MLQRSLIAIGIIAATGSAASDAAAAQLLFRDTFDDGDVLTNTGANAVGSAAPWAKQAIISSDGGQTLPSDWAIDEQTAGSARVWTGNFDQRHRVRTLSGRGKNELEVGGGLNYHVTVGNIKGGGESTASSRTTYFEFGLVDADAAGSTDASRHNTEGGLYVVLKYSWQTSWNNGWRHTLNSIEGMLRVVDDTHAAYGPSSTTTGFEPDGTGIQTVASFVKTFSPKPLVTAAADESFSLGLTDDGYSLTIGSGFTLTSGSLTGTWDALNGVDIDNEFDDGVFLTAGMYGSSGTTGYYREVSVEQVPEPTALSLAPLAGAVLCRRVRRSR
jgi:hypothetical protein